MADTPVIWPEACNAQQRNRRRNEERLVNSCRYYSPQIYSQIGISNGDTLKYQAINSVIALVAQSYHVAKVAADQSPATTEAINIYHAQYLRNQCNDGVYPPFSTCSTRITNIESIS
jgi:hypothetical protein